MLLRTYSQVQSCVMNHSVENKQPDSCCVTRYVNENMHGEDFECVSCISLNYIFLGCYKLYVSSKIFNFKPGKKWVKQFRRPYMK